MRERVRRLYERGMKQVEIARLLGVSKTTVIFHIRRLDVPVDERFGRRYDWKAIQEAYDSGLSRRECMERFGFSAYAWSAAVKSGKIKPRPRAIPIEELLVKGRVGTSRTHLKERLLKEGFKRNICEACGLTEWQGRPLNMQLHHNNGDGSDNRLENISFLCPNCHAQTDTWGGRNGHRRRHLRLVKSDETEPDFETDAV
jgi:hypothetical protein